jgi:uncharacterized protein (DUF736 family)
VPLDLEAGKATVFKNDKGDNPKRPDYRGELKTPDGTHLEIALWVSEAKSGQKYLSGRVQVPQETNGNGSSDGNGSGGKSQDDLPF